MSNEEFGGAIASCPGLAAPAPWRVVCNLGAFVAAVYRILLENVPWWDISRLARTTVRAGGAADGQNGVPNLLGLIPSIPQHLPVHRGDELGDSIFEADLDCYLE